MKAVRVILVSLLISLVAIQFIHPERNISKEQSSQAIAVVYGVPASTADILKKACNDCHSNYTRYPWYANIQPVAWWLDGHIREGKEELNFSDFGAYPIRRQYHKLEEIAKMVKEEDMPLGSYKIIHPDARLTDSEKANLVDWANSIRSTITAKYPPDSLARKK